MRDKAIYFPYINVPSNPWFTRLLLYWDRIGSIVPYDYVGRPDALSPHMRELVSAELVEQIIPGQYIYSIPNFTESFVRYLQKNRNTTLRTAAFSRETPTVEIHIEKLDRLADELVSLGVARPLRYPWYEVNANVAKRFMAYLATTLGTLQDVNAAPITNDQASLCLLSGFPQPRANLPKRQLTRSIILSKVMPVPATPVSVNEIVNFKSKYGTQLNRFRRRIESRCIDLNNLVDQQDYQEQLDYFTEELNDEILDIAEKMKINWSKVVLSGLFSVCGAGGALVGTQQDEKLAILAGSFSLVAAVYQAFDTVNEKRNAFQNPLAYGALVRRTFLPANY